MNAHASQNAGDEAYLYDSAGADALWAEDNWADFTRDVDRVFAEGFKRVAAKSNQGGDDTVHEVLPLDYLLDLIGPWRHI